MAAAGKASEAETYARKWLVDNPKDVTMRMELAGRALRGKKQTEAFGLYQQAVAIEPNNALALNNLASVAGELGDSRAIGYAERAVFIAPNTPAYLDTLGMLLVNKGEAKKGLEYLERARKLSPEHPVLRLNYAKALSKLGRKEEARKELEALKSVSADFPGKEEIDQLLKEL
jgi:predicted Zn-dependent protease